MGEVSPTHAKPRCGLMTKSNTAAKLKTIIQVRGKVSEPTVPFLLSPTCQAKEINSENVVATGGGLVKEVVTYMVLDDLVVKPMSTISSITLLNEFSVKDVGVLKEKAVTLGVKEALLLLKTSLQSKNVLTNVFMAAI